MEDWFRFEWYSALCAFMGVCQNFSRPKTSRREMSFLSCRQWALQKARETDSGWFIGIEGGKGGGWRRRAPFLVIGTLFTWVTLLWWPKRFFYTTRSSLWFLRKRNASNSNYTDLYEPWVSAIWFVCFCIYYTGLDYNNSSRLYKVLQSSKHFMLLILTINTDEGYRWLLTQNCFTFDLCFYDLYYYKYYSTGIGQILPCNCPWLSPQVTRKLKLLLCQLVLDVQKLFISPKCRQSKSMHIWISQCSCKGIVHLYWKRSTSRPSSKEEVSIASKSGLDHFQRIVGKTLTVQRRSHKKQ